MFVGPVKFIYHRFYNLKKYIMLSMLPAELVLHVLSFLAPQSAARLKATSSEFSKIVDESSQGRFLKYVYEQPNAEFFECGHWCACDAARRGDVSTLTWLSRQKFSLDGRVLVEAIVHAQPHCITWALESGLDPDTASDMLVLRMIREATVKTIQSLHVHECVPMQKVCAQAARDGRLDVIEWAYANDARGDERTCAGAGAGGHTNVLEWLRSRGCPWDKQTTYAAAYHTNLATLRWAVEQGCEWDAATFRYALHTGDEELLAWMLDAGCSIDRSCVEQDATTSLNPNVLAWVRTMGLIN
jgi:hypothetical protein